MPEAALALSADVFLAMLLFIEYPKWFTLQLCL
jgi:hypothetical protein